MNLKMENNTKKISVQQWLDYFNKYPTSAQLITSYARTLYSKSIDEVPDNVSDIFAKASKYFGISSDAKSAGNDCFYAIDDKNNKDLDRCLYTAIHRYQFAQLKMKQEEYETINKLLETIQDKEKHSISTLSVELYIKSKDFSEFDKNTDEKFLEKIKVYITNNFEKNYNELQEGIHKKINENIENASSQESQNNYRQKYDKVFTDEFYKDLQYIHDNQQLKKIASLAVYCGYDMLEKISDFHSDLKSVYCHTYEQSSELLYVTTLERINNTLANTNTPLEPLSNDNEIKEYVDLMRGKKNVILQGAPGVGKTRMAQMIMEYFSNGDDSRVAFVTFHQSFDYEDFVEGIHAKPINGNISYELEDGIFKKMALEATSRPNEEFLLVIDEINRGNVSKIFGELISLIEEDKRELGEYPLHATLPYSRDIFIVPSNLYILGTMNTTDRSVGSIDYALRRRFSFRTVKANRQVIVSTDAQSLFDSVEQFINSFKTPEILNHSDIMVGHGYFKDNIDKSWEFKIKPLLEEYINDGILKKEAYDQLVGTDAHSFIKKIKNYNTNKKMTDD